MRGWSRYPMRRKWRRNRKAPARGGGTSRRRRACRPTWWRWWWGRSRRPGDDGLVGRPLAERVLRDLDGGEVGRGVAAGVGSLEQLRAGPAGGDVDRRPDQHAADLRAGRQPGPGERDVRRDHLREGRL